MTNQPEWEIVGTLGDINIAEFGGGVVYRDKTGVYDPKTEWFEPNEGERADEGTGGEAYRYILDPCTFINGVLSENKFHPEHPAWWADKIDSIASTVDMDPEKLIEMFCSEDIMERAFAYQELHMVFGLFEMDQYPLKLTQEEADERYAEAEAWSRKRVYGS